MKFYSFEKLLVWQQSRILTKNIYLVTKTFPNEEKFGLTSQLRRASVSICSNIAEGSLMEVLNQLILSLDLNFLSQTEYEKLRLSIEEISNMLNGLRKSQLNSINK